MDATQAGQMMGQAFLPILLVGVGIWYGIKTMREYLKNRKKGKDS